MIFDDGGDKDEDDDDDDDDGNCFRIFTFMKIAAVPSKTITTTIIGLIAQIVMTMKTLILITIISTIIITDIIVVV